MSRLKSTATRDERRATIGQRAMVFGRHSQSAGTVCVRPQFAKPARDPLGGSIGVPAERGADRFRLGAEPGRGQSSGLATLGEGLGQPARRGLQGRPAYPPGEGLE